MAELGVDGNVLFSFVRFSDFVIAIFKRNFGLIGVWRECYLEVKWRKKIGVGGNALIGSENFFDGERKFLNGEN